MKKLAYTAALALVGVALSAPAMAMTVYDSSATRTICRNDADGVQHCWTQHTDRWRDDRRFVALRSDDVNLYDGSVRATLAPHNARGPASRPDTQEVNAFIVW